MWHPDLIFEIIELLFDAGYLVVLVLGFLLFAFEHGDHLQSDLDLLILGQAVALDFRGFFNFSEGWRRFVEFREPIGLLGWSVLLRAQEDILVSNYAGEGVRL